MPPHHGIKGGDRREIYQICLCEHNHRCVPWRYFVLFFDPAETLINLKSMVCYIIVSQALLKCFTLKDIKKSLTNLSMTMHILLTSKIHPGNFSSGNGKVLQHVAF